MSHTDPTSMPFDDALLSAYLDHELTPDQRARVEAHLADNSAARRLLDELHALARAVKKLPKETLDPDFHAAVMTAIDHAVIGKPAPVQRSESRVEVVERSPGWLRGRGWAWSAAAIATALLVMFLSGEKPGQQLAKLEDAETEKERLAQPEHTPEASENTDDDGVRESNFASNAAEVLQRIVERGAGEAEPEKLIDELERFTPPSEP